MQSSYVNIYMCTCYICVLYGAGTSTSALEQGCLLCRTRPLYRIVLYVLHYMYCIALYALHHCIILGVYCIICIVLHYCIILGVYCIICIELHLYTAT